MKRKDFISGIFPLSLGLIHNPALEAIVNDGETYRIPPFLKKGDTIGITCPAGNISRADIEPACKQLKEWGFEVRIGNTVGKKDFTFGGTDAERLADLQEMMDDPGLQGILCARGGYGLIRIIDHLDFSQFSQRPKWVVGFSDITILHAHISRNYQVASIHAKMCNSFPENPSLAEAVQLESIDSIRRCLMGEKIKYTIPVNSANITGTGKGKLIGGNLRTLETLSGTKSDIHTENKILFLEDTGEYLYSIDRMMWNMKRTGKLAKLQGLIIGGIKTHDDDKGEEFGKTISEIVLEKTKGYPYPVCFDFPVGHQKNNMALKCGVTHQLKVNLTEVNLTELS